MKSTPWIACPKPNPQARLRLFCFPYAGGGAIAYRDWHKHLPPSIEICAIKLPGRETRLLEPPFSHLPDLVQALSQNLYDHLDCPFAFFGHSMGALVSFEFARYLRQTRNFCPSYLFVSGRHAPHLPDPQPPIHTLPKPEFLARLRELNGTPQAIMDNAELMQLLLPTLRADFQLLETYTYNPELPLPCPITAFGGWDDPEASREDIAAWETQTLAAFSLQMLPGDHFFLNDSRNLLLGLISEYLQHLD